MPSNYESPSGGHSIDQIGCSAPEERTFYSRRAGVQIVQRVPHMGMVSVDEMGGI